MAAASSAIDFLASQGIPFRLFHHPAVPTSLEQAALERGQTPDQVVRSILFRSKEKYYLVLVAGTGQISWQKLRKYLGESRLSMATSDQVLSTTGYRIGMVSPFGLKQPVRVLVDKKVLESHDEVSLGSGLPGVAILMHVNDLHRALGNVEIGQFC